MAGAEVGFAVILGEGWWGSRLVGGRWFSAWPGGRGRGAPGFIASPPESWPGPRFAGGRWVFSGGGVCGGRFLAWCGFCPLLRFGRFVREGRFLVWPGWVGRRVGWLSFWVKVGGVPGL